MRVSIHLTTGPSAIRSYFQYFPLSTSVLVSCVSICPPVSHSRCKPTRPSPLSSPLSKALLDSLNHYIPTAPPSLSSASRGFCSPPRHINPGVPQRGGGPRRAVQPARRPAWTCARRPAWTCARTSTKKPWRSCRPPHVPPATG